MPISIHHTCALTPSESWMCAYTNQKSSRDVWFWLTLCLEPQQSQEGWEVGIAGGDAGTTEVSWEANRQFSGAEPCPNTKSCPRVGSDSRQWGRAAHSSCEPMTHNNNFRVTANLPDFICRCTDERRCQNPNKERLMLRLILFPQAN